MNGLSDRDRLYNALVDCIKANSHDCDLLTVIGAVDDVNTALYGCRGRFKIPMSDITDMAYFEYLNGFRKVLYWSKEKMMTHTDTYSPAFSRIKYEELQAGKIPQSEMWKYSSFWYKSFDDMAKKTMLRQLISRWGVMSIDMQTAIEGDNSLPKIADSGEVLTDPAPQETESGQPELHTEPPAALEQGAERQVPVFAAPEADAVEEMVDISQL